ncbi:carbohydrate ABC transporter permease [Mesorhizobium sp. INR15]|uniref:carbohydrate ABC transporter permease n=1 Tax=Mesorhizobium sp. INR15 TaxID=2654248 RepID=UPI00189699F7|nr:sugar ABC transporter permease [Mesorhizobium sp. INR15]QPC95518.1 ABC transporter permease subunit [Mesorhizobium sp. INR15]
MPHRTFFTFMLPSMAAMLLFIAIPIFSSAFQSFYVENPRVLVQTEACDPFGGCKTETRVDAQATLKLNQANPMGRFNGLATYTNSAHLAFADIAEIWHSSSGWGNAIARIADLHFYRALTFTLAYTFVVTPLSLWLGLLIALALNALPQQLRGVITYFTLLPMLVPAFLGALVLFWMIDARGLIGAALIYMTGNPDLSLKASTTLSWLVLFFHGAWNSAPFVFIVFYAALQTVPQDTLESAIVDGASRWQRLRFVVFPHLRPIAIFLTLVLIMDNVRVFESIVAFSATAQASSLSTLIFKDLVNGSTPLYGSAAATSMLTIVCIAILMTPSMIRSWFTFRAKG